MDYGHEEVKLKFGSDPRIYCMSSKEFIGKDGHITGVRAVSVEWTQENGQWKMAEVPGSEKIFEVIF